MKKIKFYSFASALLLASAAGLGSCASEADAEGGSSQQQNETRDVVKTQFVINIPYANGSSTSNARTRMTEAKTQQGDPKTFRGIENMILLTFAEEPDASSSVASKNTATNLCNISTDDNAFSSADYTRLYRDIQIPVGTKYFIFNGCAKRTATVSSTDPTYFEEGKIVPDQGYSNQKELKSLNYSLYPILKTETTLGTGDVGETIKNQLNNLLGANAEYKTNTDNNVTIYWKEANTESQTWSKANYMSALEESFFADRYKRLTSLTAGSVASVIAVLKDLQSILIAGEATEKNADGTDPQTILKDRPLALDIYNKCTTAITEIEKADTEDGNRLNYPRNLHLPDGVAQLKYDTGKKTFDYVGTSVIIGNTTENNSIDYTKICYPAELSYFVSSEAMASSQEINNVNQLPAYADWLAGTWNNTSNFSDVSSSGVTAATKSVALKQPVQYSVACLKTTVKCSSNTLTDNASQVTTKYGSAQIADQSITVPNGGYHLTAILVGGQPASVNWKFEPKDQSFANTIYDKDMNSTNRESDGEKYISVGSSKASDPNYTLVLDNEVLATQGNGSPTQNKVYVTLEFINNGDNSFYGADGLVPKNGKFYLVGTLNPSDIKTNDTGTATLPTKDNSTININRVFVKDHTTVANFTITSLKNAYNCIPDLRAAGLNVGLAVDLSWQDGIQFDVEL